MIYRIFSLCLLLLRLLIQCITMSPVYHQQWPTQCTIYSPILYIIRRAVAQNGRHSAVIPQSSRTFSRPQKLLPHLLTNSRSISLLLLAKTRLSNSVCWTILLDNQNHQPEKEDSSGDWVDGAHGSQTGPTNGLTGENANVVQKEGIAESGRKRREGKHFRRVKVKVSKHRRNTELKKVTNKVREGKRSTRNTAPNTWWWIKNKEIT